MAKKKKRIEIYSDEEFENEETTLDPEDQYLEIFIERKNRGGKTATVIKGFVGNETDLKQLGTDLKSKCATGGSVKDQEIIIQGEVRDKVMKLLNSWGYNTKRVGG